MQCKLTFRSGIQANPSEIQSKWGDIQANQNADFHCDYPNYM